MPCSPLDNIGDNHLCDDCRKLTVPIVGHKIVFILWQILPVFWLTTECPVDKFLPNSSIFKTRCEQTCANSPVFFNYAFCFLVIVQARIGNLMKKLLRLFVCQFAILFHAFPSMSFHVVGPRRNFAWGFSHPGNFSVARAEIRDFKHLFEFFNNRIILVCIHIECILSEHDQEMMSAPQYQRSFINFFHSGFQFCHPSWCRPHRPIRITFVVCEQTKHSQFVTFSHPSSINDL